MEKHLSIKSQHFLNILSKSSKIFNFEPFWQKSHVKTIHFFIGVNEKLLFHKKSWIRRNLTFIHG